MWRVVVSYKRIQAVKVEQTAYFFFSCKVQRTYRVEKVYTLPLENGERKLHRKYLCLHALVVTRAGYRNSALLCKTFVLAQHTSGGCLGVYVMNCTHGSYRSELR